MKMVHPIDALDFASLAQFVRESVPFCVHIWADMMRHLAGSMAEADTLVECRGAEPPRPPLIQFVRAPKAHVVPLARAVANRLLEG